jgi:tripartite-type tricarboxylate transporter receptor subunit TctC
VRQQPVAMAAFTPNLLYVHPEVKATTLPELLALARNGKLAYASGGNGSISHLSAAMFAHRAGLDMIHVPYKGNGPAITDVVAGHVELLRAAGGHGAGGHG